MKSFLSKIGLAALAVTALASAPQSARADSVGQIASNNPSLSTFMALVRAAGMEQSLAATGPITVFAPSNDAFDRLPFTQLQALRAPENAAQLRSLLSYHLVPRNQLMQHGEGGVIRLPTAQGSALTVERDNNSTIRINGNTRLVWSNLRGENGNLNVVDTVLMP